MRPPTLRRSPCAPPRLHHRSWQAPSLALCLLASLSITAQSVEIARKGSARAVVVIPDEPTPVVEYAAKELHSYLEKATKAPFTVAKESAIPEDGLHRIYIGPCKALERFVDVEKLQKNAYLSHATENALYLAGCDDDGWRGATNDQKSMGTLLAVYDWLDRALGVRWLWPGEEGRVVPHKRDLAVPPGKLSLKTPPWLFSRLRVGNERERQDGASYRGFLETHLWLRQHRMVQTMPIAYGHAFGKYWQRFGETEPGFFALRPDGVRAPVDSRTNLVQLCVSNPKLWKQITADWLIDRTEEKPWLNGCENDRRAIDPFCRCPNCLAWDVEGKKISISPNPWHIESRPASEIDSYESVSMSDRYARFLLALLGEAKKQVPDARVIGYAYSSYSDPPAETTLSESIIVSIVPPFVYPFAPEKEAAFRELWDGWKATGATLLLRPNHTLLGYCFPYIYPTQLGADFKHAFENGMKGTDYDSLTGMWGVQGPNLYLLGRLHSRPDLSVEAILDEFYSAFGAATQEIRNYFAFWEKITQQCDEAFHAKINGGWAAISRGGYLVFDQAAFQRGKRMLATAEELVADDKAALGKVHYLQVWLEQARLASQAASLFATVTQNPSNAAARQSLVKAKSTLHDYRATHAETLRAGNWVHIANLEPWWSWNEK